MKEPQRRLAVTGIDLCCISTKSKCTLTEALGFA